MMVAFRPRVKKLASVVFFFLLFFCTARSPIFAREANSLTADPNFSPASLSAEGQLWHDRLVRGYNGKQYIDPISCSKSGDAYAIARCTGTALDSLGMAIRVTGDPQFVEDVAVLMANLRASLKDVWRPECEKFNNCEKMSDGYLNFTRIYDTTSYYGSDWQQLDEQLAHAVVSNGARILQANIALHPEYQAEVDFWIDYLENHFIKKNKARRNIDVNDVSLESYKNILNRGISHPDIATVSMFYDLFVLTGKQVYLDVANQKNETMRLTYRTVSLADGTPAMVWCHYSGNKQTASQANTWCQLVEYGSYEMFYILKMHEDGFSDYASDALMQKFTNTITHSILANSDPNGSLTGTVCGRQSFQFPEYSMVFGTEGSERDRPFFRWANYWSFHAFAKWDTSNRISESSEVAFRQWDPRWNIPNEDLQNPGLGGMVLYGLGEKAFARPGETPVATPPAEEEATPSATPTPPPVEYPPAEPTCPADFNDDHFVDLSDYFLLNQTLATTSAELRYDLNKDSTVNQLDMDTLLPLFFTSCQT